jgi:hypothetical protein
MRGKKRVRKDKCRDVKDLVSMRRATVGDDALFIFV